MKILVIDDSIVFRSAISEVLKDIDVIEQVDTANNGQIGIEKLKKINYNLVILDLEMPVLDGLSTLSEMKKTGIRVPVIVYSSLTLSGAEKTFRALELGAVDFATKAQSSTDASEGIKQIKEELLPKVLAFKEVKKLSLSKTPEVKKQSSDTLVGKNFRFSGSPGVILIGSSTGGPETLKTIFRGIQGTPRCPILMVQHMPKLFTKKLAEELDRIVEFPVKEAENGEDIKNGVAYIAPGDYHMEVSKSANGLKKISLSQGEKVCYVRPAFDVLLFSASKFYINRALILVLTGMGADGKEGSRQYAPSSPEIWIQDKETSVVWGMPGAVSELGVQTHTIPLPLISSYLNKFIG